MPTLRLGSVVSSDGPTSLRVTVVTKGPVEVITLIEHSSADLGSSQKWISVSWAEGQRNVLCFVCTDCSFFFPSFSSILLSFLRNNGTKGVQNNSNKVLNMSRFCLLLGSMRMNVVTWKCDIGYRKVVTAKGQVISGDLEDWSKSGWGPMHVTYLKK